MLIFNAFFLIKYIGAVLDVNFQQDFTLAEPNVNVNVNVNVNLLLKINMTP